MSDERGPSSQSRLPLSKFDIPDACFMCSEQEKRSKDKLEKLIDSFKTIIESVGEDPNREGLVKTPLRAAKALCFFTKGYEQTVKGQCDIAKAIHPTILLFVVVVFRCCCRWSIQ